jgi:antitoxin (DNA-binding transcriptional repressor) of toxin-antitoxin stability system
MVSAMVERTMSLMFVSLQEAEGNLKQLLRLVERGEHVFISNGKGSVACLLKVPNPTRLRRRPANALHIEHIADDFDAPEQDIQELFEGSPDL